MAHREDLAYITCCCGEIFQHIPRGADHTDDAKTAEKFQAHVDAGCVMVAEVEAAEQERIEGVVEEE